VCSQALQHCWQLQTQKAAKASVKPDLLLHVLSGALWQGNFSAAAAAGRNTTYFD
jgi:hypothetical protein